MELDPKVKWLWWLDTDAIIMTMEYNIAYVNFLIYFKIISPSHKVLILIFVGIFLCEHFCWIIFDGIFLLDYFCWNIFVGTFLWEHFCGNNVIFVEKFLLGLFLIEYFLWNIFDGTFLMERF